MVAPIGENILARKCLTHYDTFSLRLQSAVVSAEGTEGSGRIQLTCFQIASIVRTTRFHFTSIVSVIPRPPPQELSAAFQGLGFPNLLPMSPIGDACGHLSHLFPHVKSTYVKFRAGAVDRLHLPD